MQFNRLSTLPLALLLTAGCASEGDQVDAAESFTLTTHSADTIDATLASGGESVRVLAVETEPGVVDLTFDFGNPVIAFRLDYQAGVGDFMPDGSALSQAQARLVGLLAAQVTDFLPEDNAEWTNVENALYRQASFMLIVPNGERLEAGQFVSSRGWTHISPSCQYQYIGSGYYRTAGKGCSCTGGSGKGCKGRCGQGCGGTSVPYCVGSTVYTRDCAKHDYGLGSWWSASDDYSFASNNASCGGNCY